MNVFYWWFHVTFFRSAAPIVPTFIESNSNSDDELDIGNVPDYQRNIEHFDNSFDSLLINQNDHHDPLAFNSVELNDLVNIDEFLSI